MKLLHGSAWVEDFLDYDRPANHVYVYPRLWATVAPVASAVVPPRTLRNVLNYTREIGVRQVARKIRSRLRETYRNEKFVSIGVGATDPADPIGSLRVFVAPLHPRACDLIAVDERLTAAPSEVLVRQVSADPDKMRIVDLLDSGTLEIPEAFAGWRPESGLPLPTDAVARLLEAADSCLANQDWSGAAETPARVSLPTVRKDRAEEASDGSKKTGVVIGLGQYAKTNILPNVAHAIDIRTIYEIDPTQIGPKPDPRFAWDTGSAVRGGERYDVHLIAGYHSTHATLAINALDQGAYVTVEKPLVTTHEDLDALNGALGRSGPKLFTCFHKRYSPLNTLAQDDLAVTPGDPVDYHCIVYEIPLPTHHWYNWPSSRTRIVSNGCHWIDHFLFMNDYNDVTRMEAEVARSGVISVFLELTTGAVLTMTLTDTGSERLGVRDYVEMRANGRTVVVEDSSRYRAESRFSILRTKTVNKMFSYENMYKEIASKIRSNGDGDSLKSVELSSRTVLRVDDMCIDLVNR